MCCCWFSQLVQMLSGLLSLRKNWWWVSLSGSSSTCSWLPSCPLHFLLSMSMERNRWKNDEKFRVYWFGLSWSRYSKFINRIVLRLTVFGTLYLILFTALPFSVLLWDKGLIALNNDSRNLPYVCRNDIQHSGRDSCSPSKSTIYKTILGVIMYYFIPAW